ncbi:hypothetical protein H5410_036106 [Solanum commersonii]|uniref:DUF4283 domain-containing protein n=1 Tax=Solanum commersonii TaxID=4109 RepID=A0A9J5Y4F9_SOLCO|nr:hypothetical protein H5410_036106 [Solanum commersonii]
MEYTNEIPCISWTEDEVDKMKVIEGLQFAVIGKFFYEWPDLEDLRKKCKIKGEFMIGLLRHVHTLMSFNLMKDFINILSKNAYYIIGKDAIAYQMRPFIYDANFKPGEETTQAMA